MVQCWNADKHCAGIADQQIMVVMPASLWRSSHDFKCSILYGARCSPNFLFAGLDLFAGRPDLSHD